VPLPPVAVPMISLNRKLSHVSLLVLLKTFMLVLCYLKKSVYGVILVLA
jgi:hypothetical protein